MIASRESRRSPRATAAALVLIVRAYRRLLSPLFPPSCRFTPTCSEYAIMALRRHGVMRGLLLTTARVIRCNPWSAGGEDPVPD